MQCDKFAGEDVSAYIDGMLEGDRLRQMSLHIEQCDACRGEYEALLNTRALLRKMATPAAPPDFWANAHRAARLAAPPKSSRVLPTLRARLGAVAGFCTAVGAAVLLLVVPGSRIAPGGSTSQLPAPAAVVDVGELVQAHASYAAAQPLTDRARVTMVTSEIASQNSEAAASADAAESTATEPVVNAAIGMD